MTHRFGGAWTERKLTALAAYLERYNTALKNQFFHRIYIDAFAGTGQRSPKDKSSNFFEALGIDEICAGSARKALETSPPFDEYFFIEKSSARFHELKCNLLSAYPDKVSSMRFERAEANSAIKELCTKTNWRNTRAVLFLDPYGTQVDWETIKAVAATEAIDLWYLFPAGMAIHRMTPRTGDIPPEWEGALDRCIGSDWRDAFYRPSEKIDLFGSHTVTEKIVDITDIEEFFLNRLRSLFPAVAPRGLQLPNSKGVPMYLLCFASANPSKRAVALSLNLAKAVLKDL